MTFLVLTEGVTLAEGAAFEAGSIFQVASNNQGIDYYQANYDIRFQVEYLDGETIPEVPAFEAELIEQNGVFFQNYHNLPQEKVTIFDTLEEALDYAIGFF